MPRRGASEGETYWTEKDSWKSVSKSQSPVVRLGLILENKINKNKIRIPRKLGKVYVKNLIIKLKPASVQRSVES